MESPFSSSSEDLEIDESSSTPTGSEDLLDPKFLSPRDFNNISNPKGQGNKNQMLLERPQGYSLLPMPDGTIFQYLMPKCDMSEKNNVKRLENLFSNVSIVAQKDNKDLKTADIEYDNKSNVLSRNTTNGGFLCSIKEDHVRENSVESLLMDKPIRTLRDVYKGIRNDLKEKTKRKQAKNSGKVILVSNLLFLNIE